MAGSAGSWFYRIGKRTCSVLAGVFFRLRAYDLDHLPRTGGALLLSNHQSYLDPVAIGAPSRRELCYLARESLFRNRVFGAVLRGVNVLPVRRGRPDKSSMRRAIERLRSGHLLLMFPEGTRTRDGELQPIRGGFRLLVRRARVPVVPVAVDGGYKAWPRWRLLPVPAQVRVIYGRRIPAEEFDDLSDEEAGERVAREISALLGTLRSLP